MNSTESGRYLSYRRPPLRGAFGLNQSNHAIPAAAPVTLQQSDIAADYTDFELDNGLNFCVEAENINDECEDDAVELQLCNVVNGLSVSSNSEVPATEGAVYRNNDESSNCQQSEEEPTNAGEVFYFVFLSCC